MPQKEVDSKEIEKAVEEAIPSYAKPTKWTAYILSSIFILVLAIGIMQFPFSSLLSGNTNATFEIGIPFKFLVLSVTDEESSPLKPLGLILDLLIYILLSYVIDIGINIVIRNFKKGSLEKQKVAEKKETYAEEFTKKIFKK